MVNTNTGIKFSVSHSYDIPMVPWSISVKTNLTREFGNFYSLANLKSSAARGYRSRQDLQMVTAATPIIFYSMKTKNDSK